MQCLIPFARRALARASLALFLLPPALLAQATGRIAGTVQNESGAPLAHVQATIPGTRFAAATAANGRFAISGVPVGTHQLKVMLIGYRTQTVVDVAVQGGVETELTITMTAVPTQLGGVVVSASRQAERITDAPATISLITPEMIETSAGNSFVGALKHVKGIDFIQTGMTTAGINARGFNSSFNNRMLMMEDGRIAVLPENGLPVGTFTTINKLDLAGVEVLVGPGAALYGPDASNGVLTLITKDPKLFPGTSVELTGGSRRYMDLQFRHAGVVGNTGFKVTGEYLEAQEFENRIYYQPVAPSPDSTLEAPLDWNARTVRAGGSVVRYMGDARAELGAGISSSNGVGQTNVGRNQLKDWRYKHLQARYTSSNWYGNAYATQSTSGESYAVNRFSVYRRMQPASVSDDSVRKLGDWPSNGRMYAAEIQNNFRVAPINDTKIIWGLQFRRDQVSSDREWLSDRLTGKDLQIEQKGIYAQSETPLLNVLRLVVAGRYDKHQDYDAQFSPKVGLVVKPTDDQSFRVTYNKAFKSPTTLQNHFAIVDFLPFVAVYGNKEGFRIRNTNTGAETFVDRIVPEENETWELGYKGVLGQKLFVDVSAYRADYENFMTPLLVIANPFTGTVAYQGSRTTPIANEAGNNQVVLTYRNLGRAEIKGLDAGLRYLLTERVTLNATAGLISKDTIDLPATLTLSKAQRDELSNLNSPSVRWTAGADWIRIFSRIDAGFNIRHSADYFFASGINNGSVPAFTTADINMSYRLFSTGAVVNLAVANLFTCAGQREMASASDGHQFEVKHSPVTRRCGIGQKHREMVNMPQIGTMIFLGMRYNRF